MRISRGLRCKYGLTLGGRMDFISASLACEIDDAVLGKAALAALQKEKSMGWSIHELKHAREAVGSLLDELGLDAYVFGVEPRDGEWRIQLDCAEADCWRTVELRVGKQDLGDCPQDPGVRRRVLDSWQIQLLAA